MRVHLQRGNPDAAVSFALEILLNTRVLLGHLLNDDRGELRDHARTLAIRLHARDIGRAVDALRLMD